MRKIVSNACIAVLLCFPLLTAANAYADSASCTKTVSSLMAEANSLPPELKAPLQEYMTAQPTGGQVTQDEKIAAFLMQRQTLLQQMLAAIEKLQQQPAQNVENGEQVLAQLTKVITACQQ